MVLGHTEQHEELGVIPIRLPEFPERAAHRVDAACGHVDRAKAAVCCEIRRAEILRPVAREALRLIAPGEEGEFGGIGLADRFQPVAGDLKRLIPADLLELARASGADAFEGCAQARGRVNLHDPRRALGAEHALVHRVIAIALDIRDLAILHVHVDAAAAGAHVAGGLAHLVGNVGRSVDMWLMMRHGWPCPWSASR